MKSGKLIVIEGACDGIGKTTQYEMLIDRLSKDGEKLCKHHFPSYNTYQAKPVEMYLKGEYGMPKELSPYFINSLYAVDRAITWYSELKPLYERGETILLDRYTTSSLIYQSALIEDVEQKKKFIDFVIDFEYNKIGIKKPDHVVFLLAPFELISKMRNARLQNDGVENDIHESNLEFMKKVYKSALFIADYLNWDVIQCNDNDVMRSKEEIHQEIYNLIQTKKS